MSGLERLRKFAGNYSYISSIRIELMGIANEIEDDIARWYLPRPVIDGEPVQFGDELMIELRPIELKERHIFETKSIQFCNDGNAYIDGFEEERCERVQHDSIEKLRIDMCNFNGCGSGAYIEFEACRDCNVTEWLKRAENLFKDGGE